MEKKQRILTDADALDRLRKDIIILLSHQPFFAYLLTKMKKVMDKRVPVAGVSVIDGEITLYINPEGYLSYTREERTFILIHEVMHIIFYHHIRELKRDHGLWNVAADLAINQLIETDKAHMPIDCLRVDSWEKKHGFTLPQGLTAEGYYKLLWEKKASIDFPEHLLQGALGQQLAEQQKRKKNQGANAPEEEKRIQGEIEALKEEEQSFVVKNTSYQWDEETHIATEQGNTLEPSQLEVGMYVVIELKEKEEFLVETLVVLKEQPQSSESNQSPFADLHPTWGDSTDISEQLAESMIRSAVQEAYKEAGSHVPAEIRTLIQELVKPKIQWKSILRNFIAKKRTTSKQGTWKKRNRRLGNAVMGYKKNRKLVVAVAIDTSASISEEDFQLFYTEIVNIHQNGATICLMECDAAVHTIVKFTKQYTPHFIGGGGTDFRPVFTAIAEKKDKLLFEKPDALIFFTDGFGTAPNKCTLPTLWCLTKDGRKPTNEKREEISWGTFLHIEQ